MTRTLLLGIAAGSLVSGTIGAIAGHSWPYWAWSVGTAVVLAALIVEIVVTLQRGEVGLDLIAALSMAASLAFGEPLAGNVVALMYAGGQFLESYAEGRARREMTALLSRVPTSAMRHLDGGLEEVPIEDLACGDRVLVRRGEGVPTDGVLISRLATVDQSALTGEPLPVSKHANDEILSGSTNVGDAFDIRVTRTASASTYAHIVELVKQAQESKAPSVRIADRYAVWFLLLTVAIAGAAWWLSGDRVRALAVLVVATPCPLILALPIAIISGMSRAAKAGVLIKSSGALEALATVKTVILDKTGTLTVGAARVVEIRTVEGWASDDVLRLAASLDQASGHVIAEALVADARRKELRLSTPSQIKEEPGVGASGCIEGRRIVVGGYRFVQNAIGAENPGDLGKDLPQGSVVVALAIDRALAGIIVLADEVRPDAAAMLDALKASGINRIVLASGDRQDVVDAVAQELGISEAHGNVGPDQKAEIVSRERAMAPVLMVGDGINDAPALASADVGVAMGARGSAASSESAEIVLLVDRVDNVAGALAIAHRTRRIALQSVFAGLGLSIVAMVFAALGYLPPVVGAGVQEIIDVAVILNALRALR